ncbi:MAG: type II toxin-antitoxin system YoeB family toxin, partial [Alphaproteobacteria bacterium]|nr:type II toxin-antitoxin system YoeB family toxin [Alphaproteobacteria bacterium]
TGSVGEVLSGGNPEPSAGDRDERWRFAALQNFRKDVWREPKLFERVANSIMEICKDPMTPRGNTIKRLSGDMSGYWRYRLGDFRLVYRPEIDRRIVYCYRLVPRGGAYD